MQNRIESPELLLKKLSTRLTPIEGKIKEYALKNNIFHSCLDKKRDIKPIVYEGLSVINTNFFYIINCSRIPQILFTPYEKKIRFYKNEKEGAYIYFVDKQYNNFIITKNSIHETLKNYQGSELEINKYIRVTLLETKPKCPIIINSLARFTSWLKTNNYIFNVEKYLNLGNNVIEVYIPTRIIRLFNVFWL